MMTLMLLHLSAAYAVNQTPSYCYWKICTTEKCEYTKGYYDPATLDKLMAEIRDGNHKATHYDCGPDENRTKPGWFKGEK